MKSIRDVKRTEEVGALSDKYSGKSEDELFEALRERVAAAKADGSFSPETLRSFVAFASPSLDERTRTRLNELVRSLCDG